MFSVFCENMYETRSQNFGSKDCNTNIFFAILFSFYMQDIRMCISLITQFEKTKVFKLEKNLLINIRVSHIMVNEVL